MIGIETEYGIQVEGKGAGDLVDEAGHLVRCVTRPHVALWDYRDEHPRRDLRGFTVDHLSIDPVDARFEQDGQPHSTDRAVRADRALANGARLYNDHGHPEYSTPECTSVLDALAADRAGERILAELAAVRSADLGGKAVSLFKNNTDFHGASYGTHESYLSRRDVSFDRLLEGLLPFLATRPIFAGSGKVGTERPGAPKIDFQISQRADFLTTLASVDTLHNRPLVNTRDEPHADPRHWRRVHVICGDANLCDLAGFLKLGTTLAVLRLIEDGWTPEQWALADPVVAQRTIAADPTLTARVGLRDGSSATAIEIQRAIAGAARTRLAGFSPETDHVLDEWETLLDRLATDPLSCADSVDWVAKYSLLDAFRDAEGMRWEDPALQSLDLAYHDIDPDVGLWHGLDQEGAIRRLVPETAVENALERAPEGSFRALVRGEAIRRFPDKIRTVTWSRLELETSGGKLQVLRLAALPITPDPELRRAWETAPTPDQYAAAVEALCASASGPAQP